MADVEGSDQRGDRPGGHSRRELRGKPPGPEPSAAILVALPIDWPEGVAWRTGWRLAEAEEDTVPELLRLGSDVTAYLEPEEIAAMLELGDRAHARWLLLGWLTWASANEGG